MAKVDVLLPYWGDFKLLKKAVESVINQSEEDWRLLVFDDCYPSKEPAKYFTKLNDSRIKYTRHKKNIGVTKNFNFALKAAQARYCIMMGCDDIMLPNYIERALSVINDADFYQPGVEVINKNGDIYLPLADKIKRLLQPRKPGFYAGEKLASSLCVGNWLYFPSILWKSEVIKKYGFDTKYMTVEDLVLELNIIKDGGTLFLDKDITFQYRRHEKSVSSIEKKDTGRRFKEESEAYSYFSEVFKNIDWNRAARSAKYHLTSRIHKILS